VKKPVVSLRQLKSLFETGSSFSFYRHGEELVFGHAMKPSRFEFPAGQNWSCHGCSDCCRGGLLITLLPEDKRRIEQQGWTAADGVDPSKMIVARLGYHRLGIRRNGACVFLDAAGRCRIHAKLVRRAKPLGVPVVSAGDSSSREAITDRAAIQLSFGGGEPGQAMAEQGTELQKTGATRCAGKLRDFSTAGGGGRAGIGLAGFSPLHALARRHTCSGECPRGLEITARIALAQHGWSGASLDQITGEGADEIWRR